MMKIIELIYGNNVNSMIKYLAMNTLCFAIRSIYKIALLVAIRSINCILYIRLLIVT